MNRKDKIRLRNAIYSLCKELTEQFIRWLPITNALLIIGTSIECMYAYENNLFIPDGDNYVLATPIFDMVARYLYPTYDKVALLLVASHTYKFCAYHKAFIFYILLTLIMEEHIRDTIFVDNTYEYYLTLSILGGITVIVALILHQIYGDRIKN